jgi:hypothetical protein
VCASELRLKLSFDHYRDSRRHALSTGAPATISRKVGGKFKAFEGQLEGKNILIIPAGKLCNSGGQPTGRKRTGHF